jgi:hypothetical protein
MTIKPEDLKKHHLDNIIVRHANKLGNPRSWDQYDEDFNTLLKFARKVVVNIGLDISASTTTYFEANEPESGLPDLDELASCFELQIGQALDVVVGYYVPAETYIKVATIDDGLCPECFGMGDIEGEECPRCVDAGEAQMWKESDFKKVCKDMGYEPKTGDRAS